jgi:hypothetical protein
MGKRSRVSVTGHLYDLHYTKSNTEVIGIPVGGIGAWVARLGGDDIAIEELLLYRQIDLDGEVMTLKLQQAVRKEVSNA